MKDEKLNEGEEELSEAEERLFAAMAGCDAVIWLGLGLMLVLVFVMAYLTIKQGMKL